jgi:hypothetical protein
MSEFKDYMFSVLALPNGVGSAPEKLRVSVCLNVNNHFKGFNPEDPQYEDNVTVFYAELQRLQEQVTSGGIEIYDVPVRADDSDKSVSNQKFSVPANPFCHFEGAKMTDADDSRQRLWQSLFPPKPVNTYSQLVNEPPAHVKGLFGDTAAEEDSFLAGTAAIRECVATAAKRGEKLADALNRLDLNRLHSMEDKVMKRLLAISQSAASRVKAGLSTRYEFLSRHHTSLHQTLSKLSVNSKKTQDAQALADSALAFLDAVHRAEEVAMNEYLHGKNSKIDLDEVIATFSAISDHPFLMRLLGLIVDTEITLPVQFVPKNDYKPDAVDNASEATKFALRVKLEPKYARTVGLFSEMRGIRKGLKVAYLMHEPSNTHFVGSVLKEEDQVRMISYDPLAHDRRMRTAIANASQTQQWNAHEVADSFTRGILYNHISLHEIITPAPEPQNRVLSEEHVAHGFRVAVSILDGAAADEKDAEFYSLTRRDVKFQVARRGSSRGMSTLLEIPSLDSCIHVDSPMQALINDGPADSSALTHFSSQTLFEYSGELLNLKSAFSKSSHLTQTEKFNAEQDSAIDQGAYKSRSRLDCFLSFLYFPFNEAEGHKDYKVHYDIPAEYSGNGPKLRTQNKYNFIVSREYLNGYGLPLQTSEESVSLSLKDLRSLPGAPQPVPPIRFGLLENFKPPKLYHTSEASGGPQSGSSTDRAALTHLVIRSRDANHCLVSRDARHVLPERISLEHAFLCGLLSPDKISARQSFEWKRKYNCPFENKDDYEKRTVSKQCAEGCTSYCGGTHMMPVYTSSWITPNYIPDPDIIGLQLTLFWDEKCTQPILGATSEVLFRRVDPLQVQSCQIVVQEADSTLASSSWLSRSGSRLTVHLKKGLSIWARLNNVTSYRSDSKEDSEKCHRAFWWDPPIGRHVIDSARANDLRDPGLVVRLSHAVKRPIVTPRIVKLFGPAQIQAGDLLDRHLQSDYPGLAQGFNVLGSRVEFRPEKPEIAEILKVSLQASFERLDAKDERTFRYDILPTGGLELWMRKEEYIDDPEILADPDGPLANSPERPVLPFNNSANQFSREHQIVFDADMLKQLREVDNIKSTGSEGDPFRALLSTVQLDLNVGTRKCEVREYILKGISQYSGYFQKANPSDLNSSQDFIAPDQSQIANDGSLRFKAILLGNQRPEKPSGLEVRTTIHNERFKNGKRTHSSQCGHIVDILLHRGRLTSGGNERVGILVRDTNALYNSTFEAEGLLTTYGRDIASDHSSPSSMFLTKEHIVIPPDDENEFHARYEPELGIVHFLPKFDFVEQCWKFQVELNLKADSQEMHNPFIHFSLVHFQPFAVNFNSAVSAPTLQQIKQDCRLSEVENSIWGQLTPERCVSVHFDKPNFLIDRRGSVRLVVSFDPYSLNYATNSDGSWRIRSNFFLTVEGSDDRVVWEPVLSERIEPPHPSKTGKTHCLIPDSLLKDPLPGMNNASIELRFPPTSLSAEARSEAFCHFRLRLVEVEWFEDEIIDYSDESFEVLDEENLRVRYVELID